MRARHRLLWQWPAPLVFLGTLFLLAPGGAAAPAKTEASPATDLPMIADAAHDPSWRELFAQLGAGKNRQATFEERRYFAFRSAPVVLTGEIRIVPDRGLSLRYLSPRPLVLIADTHGLLMRDEAGRDRSAPDDSRAQAATTALGNVLRFNLPELEKSFELRGRRDGPRWTLAFVPRDPALAGTMGSIIAAGEQAILHRIEIIRSDRQRIEILLTENREDVIFTGDTLRRFFR